MGAMSLGVFQASSSAALDGPQSLDGAWTLDGSVSGPGVMTHATIASAAMTNATAPVATMTGA